jgi:L-malate glycosyltransferase
MARILHIARIATAAAERRVALMAAGTPWTIRLVRAAWPDLPSDVQAIRRDGRFSAVRCIPMWRPADPHRGIYRTLGFDIPAAAPGLIHAEEEPDSLAALQVVTARSLLAPRVPLVLFTWQNVNRPRRRSVDWVLRRTLSAADAVVCGNRGAVSLLRELGFRGPTPVIPALALDSTVFHRRPAARVSDGFTVGYVGRLAPEKGIDTLIEAVSAIGPPALLAIAGAGPSRAALEARARDAGLGDRVRFLGPLSPTEVARFLNAIDVLVVPSRSTPVWQEQYGRVIVEAMGCEVPVIGSSSGAIPEVIGSAGMVFPEGDAAALADLLQALRESPAQRDALGRRGHAHATATQTNEVRAGQVLDFYGTLLAGAGCEPR